ncbi:MAG: hypothetical protein Fur0015_07720 [Ignavibacteriales bacterium]
MIPLNIQPTSSELKNKINNKNFDRTDYRYFGNILTNLPFVFEQNLGSLGQPNLFNIYGFEQSNISIMREGIIINDRWKNKINFYDVLSESVDSIEILPPSQSFFYSLNNSPILINVMNNEKIERRPISKLRFYQAPNEEGFVSVYLNTYLFSRLMISSEVSNMSINSRNEAYNDDFSNWQTFVRLKYFYSNSLNLSAHYYYSKNQVGLNGGAVNNSLIFDDLQAIPLYPSRFLRNTISQFDLNFLAKLFGENTSEFNLYLRDELQEFKQDKKKVNDKIPTIIHENSDKTVGLRFYQPLNVNDTKIEMLANYEQVKINSALFEKKYIFNQSSMAIKAKHTFGILTPSIFAKLSNIAGENYSGIGSSINMNIVSGFDISAGLSSYSKPISFLEQQTISNFIRQKITAFDFGLNLNTNSLRGKLSYFLWRTNNFVFPILSNGSDSLIVNETGFYETKNSNVSGINLLAENSIWHIETAVNINYYFSNQELNGLSIPQFYGKLGVYYVGKLFESNLDLKAGINLNFTGEKSFANIDFERSDLIYYKYNSIRNKEIIDGRINSPKYIFDVFISGIIQKRANVFIVVENVFDTKYYIMPYYLMPRRGLRLGVNWKFVD